MPTCELKDKSNRTEELLKFKSGISSLLATRMQDEYDVLRILNSEVLPLLKNGSVNPDKFFIKLAGTGRDRDKRVDLLDFFVKLAETNSNAAIIATSMVEGSQAMRVDGKREYLRYFNPLRYLNERARLADGSIGEHILPLVEALVAHPRSDLTEVEHVSSYPASPAIANAVKNGRGRKGSSSVPIYSAGVPVTGGSVAASLP